MQNITLINNTRECIIENNNKFLGYTGENDVNKLIFKFVDGFRDGIGILNIEREKERGYVSLDKIDETYEFPVKNSILTQVGDIKFQVVITGYDGSVIKYDPFVMTVKDAIDTDSEMPEDYPSWVDMANAKLAEVDEAITNTNNVVNQILEDKENGVFNGKDGIDGKDGKDGTNGVNGIDGISPIAKIVQTENGAIVTVVDADGTTTAQLTNGKDGVNGKDGANGKDGTNGTNGISPTVTTQQTDTGATIAITDVNGIHTVNLLNGKDGIDGKDGKDGTMSFDDLTEEQKATLKGDKGDKGADGYSPIANVTETETGATITITDSTGTTTAIIKNGKDGTNGVDGKDGINGTNGIDGVDGTNGVTFTPGVDSNGNLSWTNDGGLENPTTVNIKGEKGDTGANGKDGTNGTNGTDGVDGYSPTATVKTNTDTEYVLTITYKDSDGNIQTFDTPNLKGQGGGLTDLPIATESTLGGVKVGNGLNITAEGVLSSMGSTNDMIVLTQEAYDALTEKDENTFYFISDGATGVDVLNKVTLTQSEYEALITKSDTTLYFIKEVS